MNRRQKLLNWLLTLSVFAWTVLQAATTFQTSYLRMGEAFRDFGKLYNKNGQTEKLMI